jgi:hypothetical protein
LKYDEAQIEAHLFSLAPAATAVFQQGGDMMATQFLKHLHMLEHAIQQGKMRHHDDTLWTKENLEQIISSVQTQVFFPVRPPLYTRADPTVQTTVITPASTDTKITTIVSKNFVTFWIIYHCLTTGDESTFVVRRLDEADAVFGYRHFIDLFYLWRLLPVDSSFYDYFRTVKRRERFWEVWAARFHMKTEHFVAGAKSKRVSKDTAKSVGGQSSGTIMFVLVFLGYMASREGSPHLALISGIFTHFFNVISVDLTITAQCLLLDGTMHVLQIRQGRVIKFKALIAKWQLTNLLKKVSKSFFFTDSDDWALAEVMIFLFLVPSDAHVNILDSSWCFLHKLCQVMEKQLLVSPLVKPTRPLGHDGEVVTTFTATPDLHASIFKRFIKKNAGSMQRAIPETIADLGARAARLNDFYAARYIAKLVCVLAPLIISTRYRGDLVMFDESRVGKQQLLLVHAMICGLLCCLPIQILPDTGDDEDHTIVCLSQFNEQAKAYTRGLNPNDAAHSGSSKKTPSAMYKATGKHRVHEATKAVLKGICNSLKDLIPSGFACYVMHLIFFWVCYV